MGQAQPFQSEVGKAAIVKDGVDATPTYVLVPKAQIEQLETLI